MSTSRPGYGKVGKEYGMRLATTPPEEDGPVWMVNLMKYKAVAEYGDGNPKGISGREADDLYSPTTVLREIGATIPFYGDVIATPLGDGTQWDRVGVVKYPTRRSFIDMQSREDFRGKHEHKEAGMDFTFVIGCQPQVPQPSLRPDPSIWPTLRNAPTDEDGPIMVIHVVKYEDGGLDEHMVDYQTVAGDASARVGGGAAAWFTVEGTIMGDGRQWDEVRFNSFPSLRAFVDEVVNDPDRLKAHSEHRERAIADTYTVIVRPTIHTFTTVGPV